MPLMVIAPSSASIALPPVAEMVLFSPDTLTFRLVSAVDAEPTLMAVPPVAVIVFVPPVELSIVMIRVLLTPSSPTILIAAVVPEMVLLLPSEEVMLIVRLGAVPPSIQMASHSEEIVLPPFIVTVSGYCT